LSRADVRGRVNAWSVVHDALRLVRSRISEPLTVYAMPRPARLYTDVSVISSNINEVILLRHPTSLSPLILLLYVSENYHMERYSENMPLV